MNERGHTLLEMVFVLGIILLMASLLIPGLRAYSQEAQLLAAAEKFCGQFREAYSMAIKQNVNTAIRFETGARGPTYSLYADGNGNGVLSADIASGRDRRVAGPIPLDAGLARVRVAINPGVPAIPPDSGTLDPTDPIKFGRSNMLSFSPMGTATPGTFYLAGESAQAAVRVTPGSARVRIMVCRGRRWVER
ncbi:MAG TPA: GspH/FimT family protein [Vicinamibacteria bacterium]|nr:GspH/FimT family protein [Vicinamibacteria bacterium]